MTADRIRRAVIPAAGRGTRMRPITLAVPKELLAMGSRPPIHFVLEEAMAAGVTEVAIVLRPAKALVRTYLDRLIDTDERFSNVHLTYVEQAVPTGLADAIAVCERFADSEPFALLLPDNVLLAPEYRLRTMLELASESGRDVVGVLALNASDSGRYGNSGRIASEPLRPGVIRINDLQPKGPGRLLIQPGEQVLRCCGRYVCQPHLFEVLERLRPAGGGEYDELPAYRAICSEAGLLGYLLPQPLFDVGHPSGFLAACAYLHAANTEPPR